MVLTEYKSEIIFVVGCRSEKSKYPFLKNTATAEKDENRRCFHNKKTSVQRKRKSHPPFCLVMIVTSNSGVRLHNSLLFSCVLFDTKNTVLWAVRNYTPGRFSPATRGFSASFSPLSSVVFVYLL